jgi:hypothetical protein
MALYQENLKKMAKVKQNIERIKTIFVAFAEKTTLEQKKSEEIKNVLRQLKALSVFRALSDAITKNVMAKIQTWKVVFFLVVFVSIFTVITTVIWAMRLKTEDQRKYSKVQRPEPEKVK